MATNYAAQAKKQLAPAYTQQINAYRSAIPGINKAFDALSAGLDSKFQADKQTTLEDANARGVLSSTMPLDTFASLSKALIGDKANVEAERGKEIAGINQNVAGARVNQASAIANLINSLMSNALAQKQFSWDRKVADRDYALQRDAFAQGLF